MSCSRQVTIPRKSNICNFYFFKWSIFNNFLVIYLDSICTGFSLYYCFANLNGQRANQLRQHWQSEMKGCCRSKCWEQEWRLNSSAGHNKEVKNRLSMSGGWWECQQKGPCVEVKDGWRTETQTLLTSSGTQNWTQAKNLGQREFLRVPEPE